MGRKDQTVDVGDLVWVKKEQVSSSIERILGIKWIGPFKVKKVAQGEVSYELENTFSGDTIHRATDKLKQLVGDGGYVVDMSEVVLPFEDEDDTEEPHRARQQRPMRRYLEEC